MRDGFKGVVGSWRDFQQEKFSLPIIEMVSLLPKEELPHLAESLVALTSLKRHVSDDVETVGGPIDVALISRGDGLVWIKRKQYFRPELNPTFGVNYLRDVDGGSGHGTRTRKPRRGDRAAAAIESASEGDGLPRRGGGDGGV